MGPADAGVAPVSAGPGGGSATHDRRAQVLALVHRSWREPAGVLHLGPTLVTYSVPGRSRDGDVQPERAVIARRLLVMVVLLDAVRSALEWTFELVSRTGRTRVVGPAGCAALPLADAMNDMSTQLWLAWSPSHLALIEGGARGPVRIRWSANGTQRPVFDPAGLTLQRSDGSQISLSVTPREKRRLRSGEPPPAVC